MKNVTISMEEKLARWVRIKAAEKDMSVSKYIRELIEEHMNSLRAYSQAMKQNLAKQPKNISSNKPYPDRDSIHDRSDLR